MYSTTLETFQKLLAMTKEIFKKRGRENFLIFSYVKTCNSVQMRDLSIYRRSARRLQRVCKRVEFRREKTRDLERSGKRLLSIMQVAKSGYLYQFFFVLLRSRFAEVTALIAAESVRYVMRLNLPRVIARERSFEPGVNYCSVLASDDLPRWFT